MVDEGFHDVPDLRENVAPFAEYTSDPEDHGTAVAAIIGAKGGNGSGITGMLWNAQLRLYDRFRITIDSYDADSSIRTAQNAVRAVNAGARIVNLSMGLSDSTMNRVPNGVDSAAVETFAMRYLPVIQAGRDTVTGKMKTLFIISAGNALNVEHQGLSTFFNGWGKIKLDHPELASGMIIVAATERASMSRQRLKAISFAGPLVDVAAPGDSIVTLGRSGNMVGSGTSIAAAFVTGVAGMLMSFDPSLTPDSVKKLILLGARSNPSDVLNPRDVADPSDVFNPKPVPDAYESLKLVAQGVGRPLCGNQRVWADSNKLYVRRTQFGPAELLPAVARGRISDINVLHGGHDITYRVGSSYSSLGFTNDAWGSTAYDPGAAPSGAYQSAHGIAHDYDAVIGTDFGEGSPTTERVNVTLDTFAGDSLVAFTLSQDFELGPLGPGGSSAAHTRLVTSVIAAYPQRGDTALVVVNRSRATTATVSYPCFDDRFLPTSCEQIVYTWVPDTAYLYTMNVHVSNPVLKELRRLADTTIYSLALSEMDSTGVATVGKQTEVVTIGTSGGVTTTDWCSVIYRNARINGVPFQDVASKSACQYPGGVDGGGGTFSASRSPLAGGTAPQQSMEKPLPRMYRMIPVLRRRGRRG